MFLWASEGCSFLMPSSTPLYKDITNVFIHSADGHLGCFQSFVMNKAATFGHSYPSVLVDISVHFTWVSAYVYADCWVTSRLGQFSKMILPMYSLTSNVSEF